jgi:hypothetical protein
VEYIYLDLSSRLLFFLDIYHTIQVGEPFDWSSVFLKAIDQQDICPLITSLALLINKHALLAHPVNHTRWKREFGCLTCANFQLLFTCSKSKHVNHARKQVKVLMNNNCEL